jgi:hypothetical protein
LAQVTAVASLPGGLPICYRGLRPVFRWRLTVGACEFHELESHPYAAGCRAVADVELERSASHAKGTGYATAAVGEAGRGPSKKAPFWKATYA